MPDVQFHFTEEQRQFRDVLRRFMAAVSPTTEVRRVMDDERGFDPAVWRRMADELGLAGLMVPERYGGSGFGLVELGLAMEEMGRVLLCAPYFASAVLAANALCRTGSEAQKQRWLPGIASGETLAALAFAEPGGEPGVDSIAMQAAALGGGYSLTGCKDYVVDGCNADLLLVAARTGGKGGIGGAVAVRCCGGGAGRQPTALAGSGLHPAIGPLGFRRRAWGVAGGVGRCRA